MNQNNISAAELFLRVRELLILPELEPKTRNKMMHDTLILCCHEGVKETKQAFGNLFSQVDYLCKAHGIKVADKIAIQTMRRHSNSQEPLSSEDLKYDARALAIFISAVFGVDVPHELNVLIPHTNRPYQKGLEINNRRIRCIVKNWDSDFIRVDIDQDADEEEYLVQLKDEENHIDHTYLWDILKEGMQLNLLDCQVKQPVITPRLIVVEPDYLVDISSIATCFTAFGHHPLLYLLNQMKPRANIQATLLGNFAGAALDDIINTNGKYQMNETIKTNFREKALEFCTCPWFDAKKFYTDASLQAFNLQQVVDILFPRTASQAQMSAFRGESLYDRKKAILEPSFVCEALGIQGRVDLMTTDCKLLVEQKSGRNMNIETHQVDPGYHSYQLEPHYVQLLLYYGVLQHNFKLSNDRVNIRLLYSKYQPQDGLMVVAYYHKLFQEAITYRNQLVAASFEIAKEGFEHALNEFTPDVLNVAGTQDFFYNKYLKPQIEAITSPLHNLTPLEEAYFCRMMTFVLREQMISKVGAQEGTNTSSSDLWTMPLAEKKDAGNIYTDLHIIRKEQSSAGSGYDTIILSVPDQGKDFLPNFRIGDMVYLYTYKLKEEPDVRKAILYKGVLQEIHSDEIVVHLTDGQQNADIFEMNLPYAIEHGTSDASTGGSIRNLHQFICAPKEKRDLLLGQRAPQRDASLTLTRHYDDVLDDIILRAKQAQDYFLLVGPPGTGKTSRALKFMVEEALNDGTGMPTAESIASGGKTAQQPASSILLMSYTNRAVDEICEMLVDSGIPFLRLGSEYSCDERFRPYLIEKAISDCPKLEAIKQYIIGTRVIVGTTSMMTSKPFIFLLKHFKLAIIDESSQILEPNLIGLLSAVDKFILIGDYKQLPAVVQQSEQDSGIPTINDSQKGGIIDMSILQDICLTNCRNSLFERLIHWEDYEERSEFIGILRRQGRMHPEIAEFPNRMFYRREKLEPVPCPHQLETELSYTLPSEDALDDLLKEHRMIFLPSKFCKEPNVSDKINANEAAIVVDLLRRIHRFYGERFDAKKTVGVIVPYRNQIAMVRKGIEKLGIPELEKISIDTVERYQGSQRDIIIYSFTIQNIWQLDFLAGNSFVEDGAIIDRKLNVAITRARKQMIMTGNPEILRNNQIFSELMNYVKEKGGYF
ncbi:DEAD/DEAH box helicase [Segatella copri]|uniref:DEAD/DEAH box helicase n=1 Tax=Segatella copri TaxID=165179 RepID=UPI002FF2EF49